MKLKDGEPCGHPGCLHHATHPCEGCGRVGGVTERVTVFSNGTEYMSWRHVNCDQCKKDCPSDGNGNFGDPLCDIEEALAFGSIDDGKIKKELADRANLPFDGGDIHCSEFDAR